MDTTLPKTSLAHRARKLFIAVHRWIGLIIGAWFVLVAVTGSLMAWRSEISGAEIRARYPVRQPAGGGKMLSLAEADAAVRKAYPFLTDRDIASVSVPGRNSAHYAYQHGRRGRRLTFLVDPYTGIVHRPYNPRETFMGTVSQLHTRLISGFRGYVANGVLSCVAVLLLLTGLYVWWPPRMAQLKSRITIKRGVSLNRTLYDTHNVLAIYLYPLLLLLAVTAPVMVGEHIVRDGPEDFWRSWNGVTEARTGAGERGGAERAGSGRPSEGERRANGAGSERHGQVAAAAVGSDTGSGLRARGERPRGGEPGAGRGEGRGGGEAGRREGPVLPTVAIGGARLSDDELLSIARAVQGDGEVTRLRRPSEPDQALQVTYVRTYGISRSHSVFLNPYTGERLEGPGTNQPERQSAFMRWVHQLHHGEFGGAYSKSLYTLAGLLPLGLFLTGVTLWARKLGRKKQTARDRSTPALRPVGVDLGSAAVEVPSGGEI